MIRKLTPFYFSLNVIVLSLVMSTASANTISGTISLPSGVVAPAGGVTLTVRSLFFDTFGFGRDTVTIPPGGRTANYTLIFSNDDARRINFDCTAGCDTLDITTEGGWDTNDGVVGDFSAEEFSGSTDHTVNITLETADSFSGTISLPGGIIATGGEFLFVSVRSNNLFALDSYSSGKILEVGDTSFNFRIGAPTSETADSWSVRYVCLGCVNRIEQSDHYPTAIDGGSATLSSDEAFIFLKDQDYAGIELVLIDNEPEPPVDDQKRLILGPLFLLLEED